MFRFGTKLGGLTAAAAVAAFMSFAAPASATTYVKLISSSMDTMFQANISGDGNVYASGMTFSVKDSTAGGVTTGAAYDIFGFCVDPYHNITLGNLGYIYASNQDPSIVDPLPTDFGGHTVDDSQLSAIQDLINTGYQLHQSGNDLDTRMRIAAIQAAIWKIEAPSKTVNVISANLNGGQFATYQQYFSAYTTGAYTPLGDSNDRFYVIADGVHQSFGIAWPIDGVPEPATWGMMLMGFGAMGAVLRRRRQTLALAA